MYTLPNISINFSYDKTVKKNELYTIHSSNDIFKICPFAFDALTLDWREEFIVFCLNRANKVIGHFKVSAGGVSGTVVDMRLVLTPAILTAASGIILAHNHPSGNTKPSNEDCILTKRVKQAAELIEIRLLDHVIVADAESYYSFADEGML